MAQKITKETIVSEGKKRTYYLYVPKSILRGLVILKRGEAEAARRILIEALNSIPAFMPNLIR